VRLLELYHALGERVLLTGRLRGAEARIAQLDAHAARQESALSRGEAERQAVQRDLEANRRELSAIALNCAQLRQDVELLHLRRQHTRDQYEHSTSWRLTAPLRALARRIRR
jgi:chromosome segregation ATPase